MWAVHRFSGLSDITVHSWMMNLNLTGSEHALMIFIICMCVLMLPKFLAVIDVAFDRKRRLAFGGLPRAGASVVLETAFSTLHAPLQMLWHLQFVVTILLGLGVHWGPQNRTAGGTAWGYALRHHWGHMVTGVVWGGLAWWLAPAMFWWFVPVFTGMVLAVPFRAYLPAGAVGACARARWDCF